MILHSRIYLTIDSWHFDVDIDSLNVFESSSTIYDRKSGSYKVDFLALLLRFGSSSFVEVPFVVLYVFLFELTFYLSLHENIFLKKEAFFNSFMVPSSIS